MATYTSRTVASTRHEWIVPASQPWGATWADVSAAIGAAWSAFRELHGLTDDAPMPGDFVRLYPKDDDIVIQFTTEEPTS